MCHVLIIEDQFLVADHVGEIAQEAGATSLSFAETQTDAIDEARARLPGLILSDVELLVGTGPGAVEQIQRELGAIPVIFITAAPERCIPCEPPAVIIAKPFEREKLTVEIKRLAALS